MIKKYLNYFLKIFLIILITFSIFLLIDFFFGEILVAKYIETIKENPNYHKKQRIRHEFYHHALAPNIYYKKTGWGSNIYKLCTDEWGLKYKCNTKSYKSYKIAIIGDSFVEAIGLPYEESFVGLINKATILEVANMGVSSYSPKIYYSKLKFFLEKGFKFDHVIVYVDVSDLFDDMNSFVLKKNGKVRDKSWDKRIEWYINAKFPVLDQLIFITFKSDRNRNRVNPINVYTNPNQFRDEDLTQIYTKKLNLRSVWTYTKENKIKGYDYPIDQGVKEQLMTMDLLYNYLAERKIKFSIAVYPWPQTILNDVSYNKHVKMWEEFCKSRCVNFINHYPLFMNDKNDQKTKMEIVRKYYILNDVHFNAIGNKIVADDFLKKFKF
jgi:hypothetical protein